MPEESKGLGSWDNPKTTLFVALALFIGLFAASFAHYSVSAVTQTEVEMYLKEVHGEATVEIRHHSDNSWWSGEYTYVQFDVRVDGLPQTYICTSTPLSSLNCRDIKPEPSLPHIEGRD